MLTTPNNYDYTPTLSNEGNVPITALNLTTGLVTMATRSNVQQTKTKRHRYVFPNVQLKNKIIQDRFCYKSHLRECYMVQYLLKTALKGC